LLAIPEEGDGRLLLVFCIALDCAVADSVMLFPAETPISSLDEEE